MRKIIILLIVVFITAPVMARNITFDDLYSIPGYGGIQISPDGHRIIFVLSKNNLTDNSSSDFIWIMNSDGTDKRRLTDRTEDEWRPRWSPDGKFVYFLAGDSNEVTQVWRYSMTENNARPVTGIVTGVRGYECSPSGENLIFVSGVYPDCHDDSCNQARSDIAEADPVKARLYDKLLYRHYNRWDNGRVSRLFIADVADGIHRELYSGPNDAPTSLLDGYGDYALSPDEAEVCFVMNTGPIPAVQVNNDLFIASTEGGDPTKITDNEGLDTSPLYSPDGKYIAYHSMARAGYESDQRDLVIYDRQNKIHRNITADFDLSIGGFDWGPKSRIIYFSSVEHGFVKIWKIDISSGDVELLLGDAVYGDMTLSPDGKYLVVSRSLSDQPYELHRYDLSSGKLTRLTDFVDPVISGLNMNRAQDFWFTGALDDSVHGWLTLPPDFDSSQKYPLVLLIHGGPQWCWLGDFNYYGWNTQLMAAQGYVVAQIDIHGSVGYGIKFKEYVSGNWGKGDYEDLMKGVDYLIETHSYIDSTRMAALGRSYGGFMANWICGHTDRFKCLVSIDGTYNHISGYGSTEELWFPEWEYKGTPYNNWDEYVRSSPVTYAKNFKTPTMVIHGQYDYRVDISEGLQMFTALQRQGVPSQLLYLPDEGHNARKLRNLRVIYENQFEWLKKWLAP